MSFKKSKDKEEYRIVKIGGFKDKLDIEVHNSNGKSLLKFIPYHSVMGSKYISNAQSVVTGFHEKEDMIDMLQEMIQSVKNS